MGKPRAEAAADANEKQAREIPECLDVDGASPAPGPGNVTGRHQPPRPFCTIRSLSPDGQTVVQSYGKVRAVTRVGLSLISSEALEANTDVQVTVTLADGRAFNLTGTVGDSRTIRPPWHLTEVRLQPVDDGRLTGCSSGKAQTLATIDGEKPVDKRGTTDRQKPDSALSVREHSLRLLANVARHGITSKETISKIIRLTLSPDHVVRRATIPALFQARGPEASVALVNLLHDPSAQTQAEAAEILGRLEASSASEPLKTLLAHDDAMVALRAAEALGRLKDDSGLAVAIRHLRTDHDHTPLAAQVFGVIVGQRFRPTPAGVAEARRYLKKAKL